MAEAHERKSKRLKNRDWCVIRDKWLNHIPNIDSPGTAPEVLISELTELGIQLGKIAKNQVEEVVEDIPGLKPALLHESVFLLHKGAHVLAASIVHLELGMCTWSVPNAYQAAFFSAKAVLGLLGVCVVEVDGRHFLIDVWGTPKKPKRNSYQSATILASTGRNEQRHIWAYFLRVLGKTTNYDKVWSESTKGFLLQHEYKDFARHRNDLHYRTREWFLDDLHGYCVQADFGRFAIQPNSTKPDFSLSLAYVLVSMGRNLLHHLAEDVVILDKEMKLLDKWLGMPHGDRYRDAICNLDSTVA